ncbi:hypothetical protein BKA61DRAFT_593736 [Leptodontidium sp. MPI-SDFR-AT-0119]|nr:hypothetical protein BKA61DRAFT_593736 [Leptodontidium sp. MPI-SDFR-AT-0119]
MESPFYFLVLPRQHKAEDTPAPGSRHFTHSWLLPISALGKPSVPSQDIFPDQPRLIFLCPSYCICVVSRCLTFFYVVLHSPYYVPTNRLLYFLLLFLVRSFFSIINHRLLPRSASHNLPTTGLELDDCIRAC